MTPATLLLLLPALLLLLRLSGHLTSGAALGEGGFQNQTLPDFSLNGTGTVADPLAATADPPGSERPAPEEPDGGSAAAESFLYSGDRAALALGGCSRSYRPGARNPALPGGSYGPLGAAADGLANTANFLNLVFQASDLREATLEEDMEWYHALARALLEDTALVQRALLTFDAEPAAEPAAQTTTPRLVLVALRGPGLKVPTILLQDLTKAWETLHPPGPPAGPAPGSGPDWDDGWFSDLKFPGAGARALGALSKRVLFNDLATLDTPKWKRGDGYVTNRSGVRWADSPFLECKDGRFLPAWLLTLSTSFYGLKPDLTPEFRGVIRVDVDIQSIDVDQCAVGEGWFSDTHQCNRTSMECEPIAGQGFRLGQYCCLCKEGYYNLDQQKGGVDEAEEGNGTTRTCYPSLPVCLPCWPGCRACLDGSPCRVQEDWVLRSVVMAGQGAFMVLVFFSMMAAYRHRRAKRIRASGLLLLETILFGSILLYFPVFILSFQPSTFRCILLRWVRMTGFSIVYGTVTLKMYRVLRVFLSRTAQRVPYMSSLHLLRILGMMLVTVCWFLCAWTVGVLQNRQRNVPILITSQTVDGQSFTTCSLDCWDYMMSVAELLFLCWGSSLCSAVRPVPSAFHEPRYMGIAIHNELLLSVTFQLLRFMLPSLHPEWMLLLSFTHTHVTTTVTLALLFIPKFLDISQAGREEIAAEVYEDEVDLRRSGSYLNSSFQSAWSDHMLEPDDIRDELKKLYAQLEVHKTKKMTVNNPHLSKKRSSRLPGLGRSIIKRIAEIPESVSRQCSREDRDFGHYSRGVAESDSFRKGPETASISYRSMNTPSPSMRKSLSEHDYAREREASVRSSLLRPNVSKRASQRSETDSLDIPPGVCKSASAQNLTIDNNLLHPDHTKLHKSRSLTSTNTHSMEDMAMMNRANSMITRSKQQLTIKEQTTSALQSQSFDKANVCPWEMEVDRPVDMNQRQVTYAYSQGSDGDCSDILPPNSPIVHVCPWDYAPTPEPSPAVERRVEGENDSQTTKAHVSASAPGTPRPIISKDQRGFSLRNTTQKWLSVKAYIGSVEAKDDQNRGAGSRKGSIVSQLSQESTCTTRSATCTNPKSERKTLPKRSLTTVEGKPCLVKQSAIRLSSGDSSDRSPRRLVIGKSAIHPSDSLDTQMYENVFSSRQNSIRSNTSSWGTGGGHSRTPSTHRRGSVRLTPSRTSHQSSTDVCPWDVPQGPVLQKQLSAKANVCPWEVEEPQVSERTGVCPWESTEHDQMKRRGSAHSNVCPWETHDTPTTPRIKVIQQSLSQSSQQSLGKIGDVCPWESSELHQPVQRPGDANICPWDVQEDKPEVVYENIKPSERKSLLRVPSAHEKKPSTSLPATSAARQISKTTDSCPWEFPDPPKIFADVLELVEGEKGHSPETTSINVCPWDTGNEDKPKDAPSNVCPWESASVHVEETDSTKTNICPWEPPQPNKHPTIEVNLVKDTEKTTSQDSVRTGVCPWESEEADASKTQAFKSSSVSLVSQDTARANICPWDEEPVVEKVQRLGGSLSDVSTRGVAQQEGVLPAVCPWEAEEPAALQKQDSGRGNVCPWDTGVPEDIKKTESGPGDVCPWDTGEPVIHNKQESVPAAVCPWDNGEPAVPKKTEIGTGDVCPWDTGEPAVPKKTESGTGDVCPWDTGEQALPKKTESGTGDICPWDTGEPAVPKIQESGKGDVCPWDTGEPAVLKKTDSGKGDVCPWETREAEVIKKPDVCPWESEEPALPKSQDNGKGDVCPWDTGEPAVLQKQDSGRGNVCPWDTGEPEALTNIDSVHTNVCPWETEEPPKPSVSPPCINLSDIKATETPGAATPEEAAMQSGTDLDQEAKANLPLGRRDALCPWPMETSMDNASDVFTWEPENIPEEDEEADAECEAEAFFFPSDL
ncbi:probable G-protein coupled receptor 179 [Gadus morhua]|uniref:probable G-protein coupled receptor 179 n=1 Tax=Gadus morhua TaxID=8049 RepID=UPI0011B5D470|nr:probable G-protein coupled receptor 179 [Gadus morhua]